MIMGGVSVAWGQTTLYHRALTTDDGATVWSASDIGTGKWEIASGSPTVSLMENESVIGLKSYGKGEIKNSDQISLSENTKVVIDAVWAFHGGNSAGNNEYIQFGSGIRINALPKVTSGNVTFNSTDVRNINNACSTSGGKRWDDVWTIHMEINTGMNIVTALTISGTSVDKPASYTLSSPVELTGSPTYNTIAMGQNNRDDCYVLLKSIKITETPQLSYTVKWKDSGDNILGIFQSGYDVEDTNVSIPYYRYLCKDHVLYKVSTADNATVPTCDFTLSSDAQTEYMTGYSAQSGYCVYCEEAENIDGMKDASTFTMGRCSGRKAAYCSEDITIASLPAGTYTAYIGLHGNGSEQTFTLKAGAQEFTKNDFSSSTRGEWSQAFTIAEMTDIKINGGNSSNAIDNIYIMCASANISTVDALGYSFSSTLPLDFTDTSVRAYIATYNKAKNVVTLTEKTKIPANTGVLIFSDSELTNESIPTTVESTDDVTDNQLVAVSEAMTLTSSTGSGNNYVLAIEDDKPVFQRVGATDASMSAGQAYLSIPAEARSIRVVFDNEDETTGIADVRGKTETANGFYDLQGRRVAQPAKGIYVKEGKKVIIK